MIHEERDTKWTLKLFSFSFWKEFPGGNRGTWTQRVHWSSQVEDTELRIQEGQNGSNFKGKIVGGKIYTESEFWRYEEGSSQV